MRANGNAEQNKQREEGAGLECAVGEGPGRAEVRGTCLQGGASAVLCGLGWLPGSAGFRRGLYPHLPATPRLPGESLIHSAAMFEKPEVAKPELDLTHSIDNQY